MNLDSEQQFPEKRGTARRSRSSGVSCWAVRTVTTASVVVGVLFGMTSTASASVPTDDHGTDGNVHSATWEDGLYGPYLRVVPTPKGRLGAIFNPHGVLKEAERKAGPKDLSGSQQSSLYNQLRCHTGLKSKWDLDAWRPDVGYWSTVKQGCNPLPGKGGEEDDE